MEILVQNKRARFDYQIIESLEAGIKLLGLEVKAVRNRNISIDEAWVKIIHHSVFLVGASIVPAKIAPWEKYNPTRERRLLLRKNQIKKFQAFLNKGMTIVPLKLYLNLRNLIKIEIAVVKGKKLYDKRKTIMERDINRYGY